MPVIPVPGFGGNFVVNPETGQSWRVGSAGGVHNPVSGDRDSTLDYHKVSDAFATAAQKEIDLYNRATNPPEMGNPFEGIDWESLMRPSASEQKLLDLQISQIEEFNNTQRDIMAREAARRTAYNRYMTGGSFTPSNMEEEQGLLAARAAEIAGIEQTRLKDALNGKLPVSPSTDRAIREGQAVVAERNRRDFGQLGVNSSPALERQAKFDESAEILKDVDRKGYIERGIRPSIDAATFALQQIGEYVPGEIPGAATAVSGLRANRQLAANLALGMAQANAQGGGGDPGAARALGLSSSYADMVTKLGASGKGSGAGIAGMGGGIGAIAGGVLGAIAGGWWNFGIGAVPGWAVGASLGAGIGGAAGGAASTFAGAGGGGSTYGGTSGLSSFYGGGGGYTPYSRMSYGGPSSSYPYP